MSLHSILQRVILSDSTNMTFFRNFCLGQEKAFLDVMLGAELQPKFSNRWYFINTRSAIKPDN